MAPLGNAVSFVDACKSHWWELVEGVRGTSTPAPQSATNQRLGGQEKHIHTSLHDLTQHLLPLEVCLVGVETRPLESPGEVADLVVHEGEERGHHQHDARWACLFVQVSRQLVAEGFPRPCGGDEESGNSR